jgi:hypothetical protein
VPEDELARTLEGRMERQEILRRQRPPNLWAIITEGPLHQIVGSRDVMREELSYLIEMADAPHCVIQVLPFTATDAPGTEGPITLFELPEGPPSAYLEGWGAGWVVDDHSRVTELVATISMIKSCALSPADSRNLLTMIKDKL